MAKAKRPKPPTKKKTNPPARRKKKGTGGPVSQGGQNGSGGTRQFAEQQFVPLLPGQISDGNIKNYDPYANNLQALAIPPPRAGASMVMQLSDILGSDVTDKITASGKLVFHAVGDTGADKSQRVQNEADVARAMAADLGIPAVIERPSFFFHLGDVVYEFGQANCYYAQFYEPFCMYNGPILAIPGNHDGMIWQAGMTSLQAFQDNFCNPVIKHADNASSLVRTTMNQPGVYFTLEAPFVTIIGLYSNVSDKGTGIISSEGNNFPIVGDAQKQFLISELKRIAPIRNAGKTALIVAVHHPPYVGNDTSLTKNFCDDLDSAFAAGGLWPDLVLSGHSHDYERYARDINGIKLPYIVAGCGGYNLGHKGPSDPHVKVPPAMATKDPDLQAYVNAFGYLKLKATADKLAVIYNCTDTNYGPAFDSILIDLKTKQVTEGVKGREPI